MYTVLLTFIILREAFYKIDFHGTTKVLQGVRL